MRIIGGAWRRRHITFPLLCGLRPTPDRVRETVFNWLAPMIEGAACLDLFAGSGALGFEAASRGAACVVMVDVNRQVLDHLKHTKDLLDAEAVAIIHADALDYLKMTSSRFDIVFLDPPFGDDKILQTCCALLEERALLNPKPHIYLEMPAATGRPKLPYTWVIAHSKRAGQVGYYLATRYKGLAG